MGAWGSGIYQNDMAWDFVGMIRGNEEREGMDGIRACLADCIQEDEYLESDLSCYALAAASMIAAALGNPSGSLPAEITDRLEEFCGECRADDVEAAITVVQRVASESELKELWEQEGEDKAAGFHSVLNDLLKNLRAPQGPIRRPPEASDILADPDRALSDDAESTDD